MSNPHRASKVQHSLATILLQLCFAVLCGTQGPRATAERGRLRVEYAQALGYERSATPCAATFSRVLRRLDEDADGLAITRRSAQTIERNRGRWERRRLTASLEIGGYIAHVYDWLKATQAYYLQRETTHHGQTRRQVEVGLTSLDATTGSPEALLRLRRQRWHIENRNHRVRDVTYDEDRSHVRSGGMPHATTQVMAAARNPAICLLRSIGETNIAVATRRLAAQSGATMRLVGAQPWEWNSR